MRTIFDLIYQDNKFMNYFFVLLLSTLTTLGLTPMLIRLSSHLHLVDLPGERKIHSSPVPRVGGLAMVLGIVPALLIYGGFDHTTSVLLIATAVLTVFALIDDMVGLGYKTKFLGQTLAAITIILLGRLCLFSVLFQAYKIDWPIWFSLPFTLLIILTVTNAINLADGLDGMAGGIMIQVFICLGLMAYQGHNTIITLLSVAVVGALFAFLRFNTHPAVIFMGDTGSQVLGFLGIVLSLALLQSSMELTPLIPLMFFAVPAIDTAVVMVERIRKGRSPFVGDKNHLHHKLIRMGLRHSEAVLTVYIIQAFFVISAYGLRFSSSWFVLGYFILSVLIFLLPIYWLSASAHLFRQPGSIDVQRETRARFLARSSLTLLRLSQKSLEYGLPAILLATAFLPATIFPPLTASSVVLFGGAVFAICRGGSWPLLCIRVLTYLYLPLVFLNCLAGMEPWVEKSTFFWYGSMYILVGFAAILVRKLTRRENGFHLTPTDFLIVFAVLLVPNQSNPGVEEMQIGSWMISLIIFFFSMEILIGELRDKLTPLLAALLPGVAVLAFRSVF